MMRRTAYAIATLALALSAAAPAHAVAPTPQRLPGLDQHITITLPFSSLRVGKDALIPGSMMHTNINSAMELSSASPNVCTVTESRRGALITPLKAGTCKLRFYAPGMAGKFAATSRTYSVPVKAK